MTTKPRDPTYDFAEIMRGPLEWRMAFQLSELLNDHAPIGWSDYIPVATEAFAQARKVKVQP